MHLLPEDSINLGLLGKKSYTTSVIRIEGINPFSGAVAGEAIATLVRLVGTLLVLILVFNFVILLSVFI